MNLADNFNVDRHFWGDATVFQTVPLPLQAKQGRWPDPAQFTQGTQISACSLRSTWPRVPLQVWQVTVRFPPQDPHFSGATSPVGPVQPGDSDGPDELDPEAEAPGQNTRESMNNNIHANTQAIYVHPSSKLTKKMSRNDDARFL